MVWPNWLNQIIKEPGSFIHGSFFFPLGWLNWWFGSVWAFGQGATEVHCELGLDLPGLIHTWLPIYVLVFGHLIDLVCGAHLVKFEFEWGFQDWLWGNWVGFWVAALPALRMLVFTGISSRQSRSDRELVYASCPWVVDGRGIGFGVPCHFLVSPVIFWCWWCCLSAVGLGALELTWNVSNVVVSGLVLMLDWLLEF